MTPNYWCWKCQRYYDYDDIETNQYSTRWGKCKYCANTVFQIEGE